MAEGCPGSQEKAHEAQNLKSIAHNQLKTSLSISFGKADKLEHVWYRNIWVGKGRIAKEVEMYVQVTQWRTETGLTL